MGTYEVEAAQVPRTVKHEDVLLPASEPAPPSLSPCLTPCVILSDALETYCRLNDCQSQYLTKMPGVDGVSLHNQVDLVLTNLPYNIRRDLGRSGVHYVG